MTDFKLKRRPLDQILIPSDIEEIEQGMLQKIRNFVDEEIEAWKKTELSGLPNTYTNSAQALFALDQVLLKLERLKK